MEDDTYEEADLRRNVKEVLIENGVMAKMRAQMRQCVLQVFQHTGIDGKPLYPATARTAELRTNPEAECGYHLVRNFLRHYDLNHTDSVLKGEANVEDEEASTTTPPPMLPATALQRLPGEDSLLVEIVADWLRLQEANHHPPSRQEQTLPSPPEEPSIPDGSNNHNTSTPFQEELQEDLILHNNHPEEDDEVIRDGDADEASDSYDSVYSAEAPQDGAKGVNNVAEKTDDANAAYDSPSSEDAFPASSPSSAVHSSVASPPQQTAHHTPPPASPTEQPPRIPATTSLTAVSEYSKDTIFEAGLVVGDTEEGPTEVEAEEEGELDAPGESPIMKVTENELDLSLADCSRAGSEHDGDVDEADTDSIDSVSQSPAAVAKDEEVEARAQRALEEKERLVAEEQQYEAKVEAERIEAEEVRKAQEAEAQATAEATLAKEGIIQVETQVGEMVCIFLEEKTK